MRADGEDCPHRGQGGPGTRGLPAKAHAACFCRQRAKRSNEEVSGDAFGSFLLSEDV